MKPLTIIVGLAAATLLNCGSQSLAQSVLSNEFTYQGRLDTGGSPLTGTIDVQFSLWDSIEAGTQIGSTVTQFGVAVGNGLFTATPNFGADDFKGQARWVQIAVRTPSGGGSGIGVYTVLTPRQALTVTPYALYAKNNWALSGNTGTNPATDFIGTSDPAPLVLKVNSRRAMQYFYAENPTAGFLYRSMNVLGGSEINSIGAGVVGATIAGGGKDLFSGTDSPNRVTADFGTVGGGAQNTASGVASTVAGGGVNTASGANAAVVGGGGNNSTGDYAFVAGGNINHASGDYGAVGGGFSNTAGYASTVAGGNTNLASSVSFVGGGSTNAATGSLAVVAGGYTNTATNSYAAVGGGNRNNATAESATVGGGYFNNAIGTYATIAGGYANTAAGFASFAGGYNARANHNGSFVWNDVSTGLLFASTGANQFCINAVGGVKLNGGGSSGTYLELGFGLTKEPSAGKIGYELFTVGTLDIVGAGSGGSNRKIKLWAEGGVTATGAYTNISDARFKQNIELLPNPVQTILGLRGVTFNWKPTAGMSFSERNQLGFIAQEVETVLPDLVYTDEKGFKSVNYTGLIPVVVEAIKVQQKQIMELKTEAALREAENADLKTRLERLEQRLNNNLNHSHE